MGLSWPAVLAWRLRRQFLQPATAADPVAVASRVCGVQAQLPAAARLAVAIRQSQPDPDAVSRALAERRLVRTWAMRGTLHLLAAEEVACYLAVSAASRAWTTAVWQRTFLPADQLDRLAEVVAELLAGRTLSRAELADQVAEASGSSELAEAVRSNWGAVLKPLAWQGILCFGPDLGDGRVSFVSPADWLPGWSGLPELAEAAGFVLTSYLGAYGPARLTNLEQWLSRGRIGKRVLRQWLAELPGVGTVEVDGEPCYLLADQLPELEASAPSESVLLLPAFDQYLLGPGTTDPQLLPARYRNLVSRPGGWIAPVVLLGGRVAGTWQHERNLLTVVPFDDVRLPSAKLDEAVDRLAERLGRPLELAVR